MIRRSRSKGRRWFLLFLLIPFIVLLWPPFYNTYDPTLFGIPFFYWYQILWIFITALLILIAYFIEE